MRTSKLSQDTTRIFNALSPNVPSSRRTLRSAKRIASFALGHDGTVEVDQGSDHESELSTPTADIEDALSPPRSSRKRKRSPETPSSTPALTTTSITTTEIKAESTWTPSTESPSSATSPHARAKPKIPARRILQPDSTYTYAPPSNWSEIYSIIHAMRTANPTAPVDTVGCEDLFWRSSSPREQRYHTLVALMLSSQTKDTVTAAAMHRLHTELLPQQPSPQTGTHQQSHLTIENILIADPKHLDSLISKVGFHNNKTKYLQSAAHILHEQYHDDVPRTVKDLVSLPGVGPKMAHLCLSAAWGITAGIGVDVHVHRITNLWGWHTTKSPEETRMWLEGWLPRDKWHEINKLLVGLGQTVCLPVGRRCGECDLAGKGLCKGEVRGVKVKEKVKREGVAVVKYEGMGGERSVEKEEETRVEVKVEEELAPS